MILRSNCLRKSLASASILLPDFLVPALSFPPTSRPFSNTSRCRSRIGSAPLSTPEGVDLRFLGPPAKRKQDVITTELPKTLEIVGPLGRRDLKQSLAGSIDVPAGKIPLQIPPYMSLEYDKETGKASLSILDRKNRKQREMWGMSPLELPLMRPL